MACNSGSCILAGSPFVCLLSACGLCQKCLRLLLCMHRTLCVLQLSGNVEIARQPQQAASSTAPYRCPYPVCHSTVTCILLDTTLHARLMLIIMLSMAHPGASLAPCAFRSIQGQHGASLPANCQGSPLCHGHHRCS